MSGDWIFSTTFPLNSCAAATAPDTIRCQHGPAGANAVLGQPLPGGELTHHLQLSPSGLALLHTTASTSSGGTKRSRTSR